jgi:quinol monooxygenase YgiN
LPSAAFPSTMRPSFHGLGNRSVFMIVVIATIEVHEGRREAFVAEFHKVVPFVRAEAGCLEYFPTTDLPAEALPVPVASRPNVVTIVEKWQSFDALRAHFTAPHMADYRVRVKDLVASVKLQILQPA